jgi:hypothetical protein
MSAENPQYPPTSPSPAQPPQQPEGGVPPAPYPGTPGYAPNTPGAYPGYPGYPAYPAAPYYAGPMPQRTNGMAIASLAFSIASWFVLPILGAILGVIFGHIALGQLRRAAGAESGRGLAIAGLAIGYVNLILWLLIGLGILILVLLITPVPGGTSMLG